MPKIEDGTGQGNLAGVSSTNRLFVSAETSSSLAVASVSRADAFSISTGQEISLTAGASGILLLQNTGILPLAVGNISASTDTECVVKLYRNPGLGGTIVSGGTEVDPSQLNFGSSKTFNGVAYRGADGLTMGTTTQLVAMGRIGPGFVMLPLSGAIVLTTSDTLGIEIVADGATTPTVSANLTFGNVVA